MRRQLYTTLKATLPTRVDARKDLLRLRQVHSISLNGGGARASVKPLLLLGVIIYRRRLRRRSQWSCVHIHKIL